MVDAVADLNSTATDSANCADVDGGLDVGVCVCREGVSELVGDWHWHYLSFHSFSLCGQEPHF